jgi:hypothetical protein
MISTIESPHSSSKSHISPSSPEDERGNKMVNNEKLSREFQERCQFVSEVRCAGRCDIDLGEITKHNVMVCFSYFNDIAKKIVSAIKDVEYGCLPGKQS